MEYYDNNVIILVLGTAIIVVVFEVFRRAYPSRTKYRENRFKINQAVARTAKDLTEEYSSYQTKNVIRTVSVTVPITVAAFLFVRDYSALIVGFSFSAIILAFLALTKYRVKHGYFGSTATEATELIGFIAKQTSDGNPPRSRNVSIPVLDRARASVGKVETNAAPKKA